MRPNTKLSISIAFIGFLGAVVGGLLAWGAGRVAWHSVEKFDQITYPTGVISGFLSCSFLSVWYSHVMIRRRWKQSRGLMILFGSAAGVLSGIATGIAYAFGEWNVGLYLNRGMSGIAWTMEVVLIAVSGAVVGGVAGTIIGSIIRPFLSHKELQPGTNDDPAYPHFSSVVPLWLGVITVLVFIPELWGAIFIQHAYSPLPYWLWQLNMPVFLFGTSGIILSILSLRECHWREKRAYLGLALCCVVLFGLVNLQRYYINIYLD